MTPAERLLLDTIRPFANANDREWSMIETTVNSGIKVTELTGVAKTIVTDAIVKAERQSFGGNRSAAGAYAASVRWGQRGGSTSSATSGNISGEGEGMVTNHNLNTTRPVKQNDGTLFVQGDNGGWRPPTAAERNLPSSNDVKNTIQTEMTEIATFGGYFEKSIKDQVSAALRAVTAFHKHFDRDQGYRRSSGPNSANSQLWAFTKAVQKLHDTFGSGLRSGGAFDNPKLSGIVDRLVAKLSSVSDKMQELKQPAS